MINQYKIVCFRLFCVDYGLSFNQIVRHKNICSSIANTMLYLTIYEFTYNSQIDVFYLRCKIILLSRYSSQFLFKNISNSWRITDSKICLFMVLMTCRNIAVQSYYLCNFLVNLHSRYILLLFSCKPYTLISVGFLDIYAIP